MLTDGEVIEALTSTPLPDQVTFTAAAAARFAEALGGHPYLFQLLGRHAWDAASTPTIDVAEVETADVRTYLQRLQTIEAASADIPEGAAARATCRDPS